MKLYLQVLDTYLECIKFSLELDHTRLISNWLSDSWFVSRLGKFAQELLPFSVCYGFILLVLCRQCSIFLWACGWCGRDALQLVLNQLIIWCHTSPGKLSNLQRIPFFHWAFLVKHQNNVFGSIKLTNDLKSRIWCCSSVFCDRKDVSSSYNNMRFVILSLA